jgi:DNA polymerase epsilon subunit 2
VHIFNYLKRSTTLNQPFSADSDERKVTTSLLENVLSHFEGRGGAKDALEVINAFKVPLCLYDPIRKLFHHSTQPRKIFAEALVRYFRICIIITKGCLPLWTNDSQSKIGTWATADKIMSDHSLFLSHLLQSKTQLYVDRFLLIQQRLRRHSLFRPVQWGQLGANRPTRDVAELTELKALLGLVGERRYVTGFLTRQDEGRYFIEDLSARLPLDLTVAETADGIFTENCIVVAEGELTPAGAFRALAVGLPPAEPRVESLAALQGLDFFGGKNPAKAQQTPEERGRWEAMYSEDRVVILSDVHLDRPEVLENLHTVFRGFSAMDSPPSAFVLMGNFQSYDANAASVNFSRIRDNFATLGRIIRQYASLLQHSKFLLVPGPGDVGPGDILPRPPLPKAVAAPLLEAIPTAELCSNPCRIRHGPAELVLFRNNLQRKMRGLSILPPPQAPAPDDNGADVGNSPMFDHLCATVLQESHLCPVPLEYQPVAWEWDHSLWVYPLPHGLVLADAEPAARYTFDTCACLNPGSLLQGTFGAWRPTENEMEMCDVAGGDGEEEEVEDEEEVEEMEEEGAAEVIEIDVEEEEEAAGEGDGEYGEDEDAVVDEEGIEDAELVDME